ncbi:MAG: hypothetical protein G01um101416_766, partial [Microgenomates group bacterium Gr01-1014_16]
AVVELVKKLNVEKELLRHLLVKIQDSGSKIQLTKK